MKLLGGRDMGILIFLLLWFFAAFVLWYLIHVLNKINKNEETDEHFLTCYILFPLALLIYLYNVACSLCESTIGDRIKARLDKFFGI
jgi:hypothetical protein